jgi:hypothetical protein
LSVKEPQHATSNRLEITMKSYTQPSGEIKDSWVKLGDVAADIVSLAESGPDTWGRSDISNKHLIDEVTRHVKAAGLTEWDRQFITSMWNLRCQHSSKTRLSPKQLEQLWRIADLVGASKELLP